MEAGQTSVQSAEGEANTEGPPSLLPDPYNSVNHLLHLHHVPKSEEEFNGTESEASADSCEDLTPCSSPPSGKVSQQSPNHNQGSPQRRRGTLEKPVHLQVPKGKNGEKMRGGNAPWYLRPRPRAPVCVVCMEPVVFCAIGSCGHDATCAKCCLKMRLSYGNTKCSVCTAPQPLVKLCWWRPNEPALPHTQDLPKGGRPPRPLLRKMLYDHAWAPGVVVQNTDRCARVRFESKGGTLSALYDASGHQ